MIRRLRLSNFQAWVDVDLPLSPITVIIGETNAGKSALLRGMAAVLFNAFEGQAMVRQGAAIAEVAIELEDGDVVLWARGNGINRYLLNDQLFDKPGRAVPPAIQDALRIHELEFDGEIVRLQWAPQMDAPFLLADSGAKATRMLGVAGNAAVVAQASRLAQQETRWQQDALKAAETQLSQLTQQLTLYDAVETAEPIAVALRSSLSNYDAVRAKRHTLQDLFTVQSSLLPAKSSLQARQSVAQVLVERVQAWLTRNQTRQWLTEGQVVQTARQRQQTRLALAQRLQDGWRQVSRLEELRQLLQSVRGLQSEMASCLDRASQAREVLEQCQVTHASLVSALTCPACGRIKDAA